MFNALVLCNRNLPSLARLPGWNSRDARISNISTFLHAMLEGRPVQQSLLCSIVNWNWGANGLTSTKYNTDMLELEMNNLEKFSLQNVNLESDLHERKPRLASKLDMDDCNENKLSLFCYFIMLQSCSGLIICCDMWWMVIR